ncbi:MAG TPA: hypothetical protein VFN67_11445 [Polyangiales bacterium]|nr:hypothetical protein [Polyangiales bacterium]
MPAFAALALFFAGLYCSASDNAQLEQARIAIERHMARNGRARDQKTGNK